MIAHATPPTECESVTSRDAEMFADAKAALEASKYVPLRKLNCRVFEGVVELTGVVPSFYLKQLAQVALLQLNARIVVRNKVEVSDEHPLLVATSCARPE